MKWTIFNSVILSFLACGVLFADTFYVDSINGSDDNSGKSTQSAWKSLEKVNATTFKPGDKILFKTDCL